ARPRAGHRRCARRGARRRRDHLGLDGQAGAQAPQARLQRELLRLPFVQPAPRRDALAQSPRPRARRQVRRIHRDPAPGITEKTMDFDWLQTRLAQASDIEKVLAESSAEICEAFVADRLSIYRAVDDGAA